MTKTTHIGRPTINQLSKSNIFLILYVKVYETNTYNRYRTENNSSKSSYNTHFLFQRHTVHINMHQIRIPKTILYPYPYHPRFLLTSPTASCAYTQSHTHIHTCTCTPRQRAHKPHKHSAWQGVAHTTQEINLTFYGNQKRVKI